MLTEKEIEVLKLRRAGLTQIDVAEKIGVSQAAVSGFERNGLRKIKDAKELIELAHKLKVGGSRR